jgi:hypothetical protein
MHYEDDWRKPLKAKKSAETTPAGAVVEKNIRGVTGSRNHKSMIGLKRGEGRVGEG